jgi:hypothetical protein
MREIFVLGGDGHLGRLCIRELVQGTSARLIVAGRSVQRAEALALGFGERACAVYCDASDPRTLRRTLEKADAVVACCGGDLSAAISTAVSMRVPFVGLTPIALDAHARDTVGEAAWKAQVPIVVQAGALPGLPGVLAETLVRRFRSIRELRIASSGPWSQTETSKNDALRYRRGRVRRRPERTGWLPLRWRFPDPVGWRRLRAAESLDLVGFAEAHCVEQLRYFEPSGGPVARRLDLVRSRRSIRPFALSAEARIDPRRREPEARIDVTAPDAPTAACAVAGSLVAAILARDVPAGLLTPREAINPARILSDLEKRGARVSSRN